MERQKYIVSVDWFQASCKARHRSTLAEGMYLQGTAPIEGGRFLVYELRGAQEFNAIYDNAFAIVLKGFTLATIYCKPRPTQMPKDAAAIKVSNPLLYSPNWLWYVRDILAALEWDFHCISRVDLCCDFNFFADGLAPREFIERYMRSGSALAKEVQYWRVGRNKYAVIGEKRSEFRDNGATACTHTTNNYDYLRFGSRSSGVCVYLYNKSRELDDLGHKKYIRECWRKGGLEDNETTPVFRLEVSINSHGTGFRQVHDEISLREEMQVRDLEKKYLKPFDFKRLSFSEFETQTTIENVFWGYVSKYFRFKIVGRQNYPHRWKDVVLFEPQLITSIKPVSPSNDLRTGVAERNARNLLEKILSTAKELDLRDAHALDRTIDLLNIYAKKNAGEVDIKAVQIIGEKLARGYSFEEIARMKIIGASQLREMEYYIHRTAINQLRELLCDPDILCRAVEDAEYWKIWREEIVKEESFKRDKWEEQRFNEEYERNEHTETT